MSYKFVIAHLTEKKTAINFDSLNSRREKYSAADRWVNFCCCQQTNQRWRWFLVFYNLYCDISIRFAKKSLVDVFHLWNSSINIEVQIRKSSNWQLCPGDYKSNEFKSSETKKTKAVIIWNYYYYYYYYLFISLLVKKKQFFDFLAHDRIKVEYMGLSAEPLRVPDLH